VETTVVLVKSGLVDMNFRTHFFGAICAFALVGGSGAYGQTLPPVTWTLSGALSDGGALIGFFTQDTYDYITGTYNFVASEPTFGAVNFNNGNTASLGTNSTSLSIGNTSGYNLSLTFAHDLLSPSANSFTGTESYNGTNVGVTGTALAAPSPLAGGGLAGLLAAASAVYWLTRRRASAFAGALATRSRSL